VPTERIVESAGIWFSPPTPAGREHHVDARRSPAVPTNAAHAGLRIGRAAMRDGERKPERDQEERKSCRSHAKRLLFDDTIPRHQTSAWPALSTVRASNGGKAARGASRGKPFLPAASSGQEL